ncbi:hypothetical protein K1719_008969 [Acacia pycnantha]|nr:hypothetical protein K1719_008969 [Acacia pycnantha]
MEAFKSNSKVSQHVRSNSFPTAPHPIVSQFEGHLSRLKPADSASSSSSSLSHKLSGLQDLKDSCDKLLDICTIAKDCLAQSKESMYEVRSALRRRGAEAAIFTAEAANYLASRKNVKKAIQIALRDIKGIRNDLIVSSAARENDMLSMLKEEESVTVSTIESFLCFISDPKERSKQSRCVQVDLENLEMCIEDLEIGVECLSRKLIRNRISFLNIFNN